MKRKLNLSAEERQRRRRQLQLNSPDRARAGRIGGAIAGRISVESGRLAQMRTPEHQRAAGKIGGKKAVEEKLGAHHPDFDKSARSKIAGATTRDLGKGVFGYNAQQRHENAKHAGHFAGLAHIRSGHIFNLGHYRWHVKAGVKPKKPCALCDAQPAFGQKVEC